MSAFSVTSAQLRESAEELNRLNTQFMSAEEELISEENTLKGMWEGAANEAFHAAFTGDVSKMEAFIGAINSYVSALTVIAEKYEEAERRNEQVAASRTY